MLYNTARSRLNRSIQQRASLVPTRCLKIPFIGIGPPALRIVSGDNILFGGESPVLGKFAMMEAKFFRFLKIVGVGFKARAESEGRLLYLRLGYSHEVELATPPAVRVFCFKNNVVCCTGLDKHRVHQFAAAVRACKPPEPYNGKGIMYTDEVIKKKQGKKK